MYDEFKHSFYKYENMLKDEQHFKDVLTDILNNNGIEAAINVIKSSGLAVEIFQTKKIRKVFNSVIELLTEYSLKNSIDDSVITNLLLEKEIFETVFEEFENIRSAFFSRYEQIDDKFKISSYLLGLELFLRQCNELATSFRNDEKRLENYPYKILFNGLSNLEVNKRIHLVTHAFEAAVESSGMLIKYFQYKKYPFLGLKRNISPKIVEKSTKHIEFSEVWLRLRDILDCWKFSNVNISFETENDEKFVSFEVIDRLFELRNLVSNERFINLRESWQMNHIANLNADRKINGDRNFPDKVSNSKEILDQSFARLYLGSERLDHKVKAITLFDWLKGYALIRKESQKFLDKNKDKKITSLNLSNLCICKTKKQWINLFTSNGFNKENAETIIDTLTFTNSSEDLFDCPFIEFEGNLIVLPSVASNIDSSRAMASNFSSKDLNLSFKGDGFEDRIASLLDSNSIKNGKLYKKTNETEYQCDNVFLLGDDVFFVECKAHVQPYTTRQHTNHLRKLEEETHQINRISSYFAEEFELVKQQLNLNPEFRPRNIYNILLITSMLGEPMQSNNCYIIDESSFTTFINRQPPTLKYLENGKYFEKDSNKFVEYEGPITSEKLLDFIKSPPQIQITKGLYELTEIMVPYLNVKFKGYSKTNETKFYGVNLTEKEKNLINSFY